MAFDFFKKKKTPAKKPKKTKSKFRLSTGLLAAAFLSLIPIAFFSLDIAIAAGGFLVLAAYVLEEKEKSARWGDKIQQSIDGLQKKYDNLEREVTDSKTQLFMMKENISDIAVTLDERGSEMLRQNPDEAAKLQGLAQKLSSLGKTNLSNVIAREQTNKAPEKPRAIKPGMEKAPVKQSANDDPVHHDDPTFSDAVVKELMQQAIRNEHVDIFVQPVVRLPQRQVRFYEIYGRIRAQAGVYLPATRYLGLARQEKVETDLDMLLLGGVLRTIKRTAHIKRATPFFINISKTTVKNLRYMKKLLEFLARNRTLGNRLIFEMPHETFDSLSSKDLQLIEGLGLLGCSFSLDHVKLQSLDIAKLQKHKVRFVKMDAAMLLAETKNDRQFNAMWTFKRKLEANGIGVIAEKIETDSTLVEIFDYDVHYGQGYLFGKPVLEGAVRRKKAA